MGPAHTVGPAAQGRLESRDAETGAVGEDVMGAAEGIVDAFLNLDPEGMLASIKDGLGGASVGAEYMMGVAQAALDPRIGTLQHQEADSGGGIIPQEQEQHKSSSAAGPAQAADAASQGSPRVAPGSQQSPPPSASTSGSKGWLDLASGQGWAIQSLCDGSVLYRTGQSESAASPKEDVDQESHSTPRNTQCHAPINIAVTRSRLALCTAEVQASATDEQQLGGLSTSQLHDRMMGLAADTGITSHDFLHSLNTSVDGHRNETAKDQPASNSSGPRTAPAAAVPDLHGSNERHLPQPHNTSHDDSEPTHITNNRSSGSSTGSGSGSGRTGANVGAGAEVTMPEPEPLKQPSPAVNSSIADDISLQNCGHLYGISNTSSVPGAAEGGSSQQRASGRGEHDGVSGDVGAGAETTMPEPDLNPEPAGGEAAQVWKPIPPAFQPYDSFFSTATGDLSESEDAAAPVAEQPVQTSAPAVEQPDTVDVSWREDSSSSSSGDSIAAQDGEPGDRGDVEGLNSAGENNSTSGRGVSEQEPANTHANDVSQGGGSATEQEQAGGFGADTGGASSDGSSGGSSSGGSGSDSGSGGIRGVRRSRQQSQNASALLRNGTVRSHLRSQQSGMGAHNAAPLGCAAINFTSGSGSSSGSDAEDGSGFDGTIHEAHAAVVGEGSLADENMPPLAEFSSESQGPPHPHTSAVAMGAAPMVAAFQPTTTSGVQPPLLAQGDTSNPPWYPVPSSDKSVLPPKSVVKKPSATGSGGRTGFGGGGSGGRGGGGSGGRGGGGSGSGGDDGDMRSDGEEDSNRDPRWHVDHFNRWAAIGLAVIWLLYVAGPVAACAKVALRGVATVGKAFGLKVTSGLKDLTAATGVAVGEGVLPGDPTQEQGREAAALAAAGGAAAASPTPGSSGGGGGGGGEGSRKQEQGREAAMAAAGGAAAASAMSAAVAQGVKAAEQSPGTVATAVGYAVVAVQECGGCDGQDAAAAVVQGRAAKEEQRARVPMVGEVSVPPGDAYSEEGSAPLDELVPWEAPGPAAVSHTHMPGPLDLVDEAGQAVGQAAQSVRRRWGVGQLLGKRNTGAAK
ncbi:MAG: hypothetical protein WDW38_006211 [Sanguina aurantia]